MIWACGFAIAAIGCAALAPPLLLGALTVGRGWDAATVATCISGAATAGAFGVALLLYNREANRDNERWQDRRRAQAEKVAAWFGKGWPPGDVMPERNMDGVTGKPVPAWRVWVRNASDLPIFDICPIAYHVGSGRADLVAVYANSSSSGGQFLKNLANPGSIRPPRPEVVLRVLAPQETAELFTAREGPIVDPVVDLVFRDNAGRWWHSTGGELCEIRNPGPVGGTVR